MADDDAVAIRAVLDGDVDRYAELVDRYQGPALRLAFSLLGNYADAEDVAQDAFLNAYRALGGFRRGAKFSTWLYRIVVNECKDFWKRRARRPLAAAVVAEPDPEHGSGVILFVDPEDPGSSLRARADGHAIGERLSAAIGVLPMKQRTAFVLHHLHGMPLADVAGVMQCRLGTVKAHVFRAVERLRGQMAPWLSQGGA